MIILSIDLQRGIHHLLITCIIYYWRVSRARIHCVTSEEKEQCSNSAITTTAHRIVRFKRMESPPLIPSISIPLARSSIQYCRLVRTAEAPGNHNSKHVIGGEVRIVLKSEACQIFRTLCNWLNVCMAIVGRKNLSGTTVETGGSLCCARFASSSRF